MKNIRLKYFLPIAVALVVLIPASLVAWTSWSVAQDAAEVVARSLMNQAAMRLTGAAQSDLEQASRLLDSFVKSSDINQQIPDINKVGPITNFEAAAWGPVRRQDLVRYGYFGNAAGEFLGVDATNTAAGKQNRVLVAVRTEGDKRRWFFFATVPSDRSDPDTVDTADYDPRARPWHKAAMNASNDGMGVAKRAWTDAYPSFSKNELLVTQSVAVHDANGAMVGVVGVDLSLKRLGSALKALQISPTALHLLWMKKA